MRAYSGFRSYSPDHLPIIGADPVVANLWHATGHEGAGIGLAPATGELVAQLMTGAPPSVDPGPYRADRPGVRADTDVELVGGPGVGIADDGDGEGP
jgi:glycine/D-amino acid oxidase-like deaminating enzyme